MQHTVLGRDVLGHHFIALEGVIVAGTVKVDVLAVDHFHLILAENAAGIVAIVGDVVLDELELQQVLIGLAVVETVLWGPDGVIAVLLEQLVITRALQHFRELGQLIMLCDDVPQSLIGVQF